MQCLHILPNTEEQKQVRGGWGNEHGGRLRERKTNPHLTFSSTTSRRSFLKRHHPTTVQCRYLRGGHLSVCPDPFSLCPSAHPSICPQVASSTLTVHAKGDHGSSFVSTTTLASIILTCDVRETSLASGNECVGWFVCFFAGWGGLLYYSSAGCVSYGAGGDWSSYDGGWSESIHLLSLVLSGFTCLCSFTERSQIERFSHLIEMSHLKCTQLFFILEMLL